MFRLLLLFPIGLAVGVQANLFAVWVYYSGNSCDGTPYNTYTESDVSCSLETCAEDGNTTNSGLGMVSIDCTSDYQTSMRSAFGNSPYILVEVYADSNCKTVSYAQGFFASGNCEGSPNLNSSKAAHVIARIEADGSASLQYFYDYSCDDSQLYGSYSASKGVLNSHQCDENWSKWYYIDGDESYASGSTSSKGDTSIASSNNTARTTAIAAGVAVLLVIVGVVCCCRRRSKPKQTDIQYRPTIPTAPTASIQLDNTASLESVLRGQAGLWDDDVITAQRIPRDKVQVKTLISRGAFGEVYEGVFNGKRVAIKMLLPETRGSLQHVNEFLAEAKLTASMDHPSIVTFVGVAWDSLSDVCVVLEFMEGGDLRALLDKYEASHRPVGFNREKVTIALQVCHALTYLHSLMPPVIHRDLKSRNILLSSSLEAKVTDFGISRERLDRTMTAGVGTSLWMAPEVMLGEHYDDKADMFSFGIVLSELDVHTMPYTHAKQQARDSLGRQLPDAAILQQVAMGSLRVNFSQSSIPSITELGNACVALNPTERPSAAEALYRLQVVLSEMV